MKRHRKIISIAILTAFLFSLQPLPSAFALRIEAPNISGMAGVLGAEIKTSNANGKYILDLENLKHVTANINFYLKFVREARKIEQYDAVAIGGGSCTSVLGRVADILRYKYRHLTFAAVACSSDNGGLDAKMREALMPILGHTIPAGDITNAFKGLLGQWESWIYDTRRWELTHAKIEVADLSNPNRKILIAVFTDGERIEFARQMDVIRSVERIQQRFDFTERTRLVINTYIKKMKQLQTERPEVDLPAPSQFNQFAREMINIAEVIDTSYGILINGAQDSGLNIEQVCLRHTAFYALMIQVGAYDHNRLAEREKKINGNNGLDSNNEPINVIDKNRFRIGLFLLQKAFGIEGRIAVPSLDYQELYAEWHRPDGTVAWRSNQEDKEAQALWETKPKEIVDALKRGGETAIGLVPDEKSIGTRLEEFRLHPDPAKAEAIEPYSEALEIIDQVKPGGIITIGPSSFVVSSGPVVRLLAERLKEARKRGVRVVLIMNSTYNNETITFKPDGLMGFIRFFEMSSRCNIDEVLDFILVNTNHGQDDENLRRVMEDNGDTVDTYKERGAVKVTKREAYIIQKQIGVQIIMEPIVSTAFIPRKKAVRLNVTIEPWPAHNPGALAGLYDRYVTYASANASGVIVLKDLPGVIQEHLSKRTYKKIVVFVDMDGTAAENADTAISDEVAQAFSDALLLENVQIVMLSRSNQVSLDARLLDEIRAKMKENGLANTDIGDRLSRLECLPKAGIDLLHLKRPSPRLLKICAGTAKRVLTDLIKEDAQMSAALQQEGIDINNLLDEKIIKESDPQEYQKDRDHLIIVKRLEVKMALYRTLALYRKIYGDQSDIRDKIIERLNSMDIFRKNGLVVMKTGRATVTITIAVKSITIFAYLGKLLARENINIENVAVIIIDDERKPNTVGRVALDCVGEMGGLAITIKGRFLNDTNGPFVTVDSDGPSVVTTTFRAIAQACGEFYPVGDLVRYVNRAYYSNCTNGSIGFSTEEMQTNYDARATVKELQMYLRQLKEAGRLPADGKVAVQEWGIGNGMFMNSFFLAAIQSGLFEEFPSLEYHAYDFSQPIIDSVRGRLINCAETKFKSPIAHTIATERFKFTQIDLQENIPASDIPVAWIRFEELYDDFGGVEIVTRKDGIWQRVEMKPVYKDGSDIELNDGRKISFAEFLKDYLFTNDKLKITTVKNPLSVLRNITYEQRVVALPDGLRAVVGDYLNDIDSRIKDSDIQMPVNMAVLDNLKRLKETLKGKDCVVQFFDYGFDKNIPKPGDKFAMPDADGYVTCGINFDYLAFSLRKLPDTGFMIQHQREYQERVLGNIGEPINEADYGQLYMFELKSTVAAAAGIPVPAILKPDIAVFNPGLLRQYAAASIVRYDHNIEHKTARYREQPVIDVERKITQPENELHTKEWVRVDVTKILEETPTPFYRVEDVYGGVRFYFHTAESLKEHGLPVGLFPGERQTLRLVPISKKQMTEILVYLEFIADTYSEYTDIEEMLAAHTDLDKNPETVISALNLISACDYLTESNSLVNLHTSLMQNKLRSMGRIEINGAAVEASDIQLIEPIDVGSFSSVWKAKLPSEEIAAIKILGGEVGSESIESAQENIANDVDNCVKATERRIAYAARYVGSIGYDKDNHRAMALVDEFIDGPTVIDAIRNGLVSYEAFAEALPDLVDSFWDAGLYIWDGQPKNIKYKKGRIGAEFVWVDFSGLTTGDSCKDDKVYITEGILRSTRKMIGIQPQIINPALQDV